MKGRKQQGEDDCDGNRQDERQSSTRARLILELTAPLDVVTGWQLDNGIHLLLSQPDEAPQIPAAHIRLNGHPSACVLSRNHLGTAHGFYLSHLVQRDELLPWGAEYDVFQN